MRRDERPPPAPEPAPAPPPPEPGSAPAAHPGRGLADEFPRTTGIGAAIFLGGIWGFLGYTVLWEGAPFVANRPFVESPAGTLALLPVRIVLWGIHLAELAAGRTFDLSRNNWWIALAASAIGALIGVTLYAAGRALVRGVQRRG